MHRIIFVFVIISCGALSAFCLKWAATPGDKNGFSRSFFEQALQVDKVIPLTHNYAKILNTGDSSYALLDGSFRSFSLLDLHGRTVQQIFPGANFPEAHIDYINDVIMGAANQVLFSGNTGSIFSCTGFSGAVFSKQETLGFNYSQAAYMDDDHVVLRKPAAGGTHCMLVNYSAVKHRITDSVFVHDDVHDGGLSTDGILLHNGSGKLFYINYYNNEIIETTAELKYLKKFNTIDHDTVLPQVIFNPQRRSYKFASPNVVLNNLAAANTRWLAVQSMLRADNESFVHAGNHCIDIYDLSNHTYELSFHVSRQYGNELMDIKLLPDNKLLILTNKYLLAARLHL